MTDQNLIAQLIGIHWTAQEAELYTTLLHLGSQPASVVASHLNRNRVTTFHALERLASKGYVTKTPRPHGMYYTALQPQVLFNQLEEKKERATATLDRELRGFQQILPALQLLQAQDVITPKVQLFHGRNALRRIYELSFDTKRMSAYFQPWPQGKEKELREIDDWHTEQRVKRKIPVRIILPSDKEGVEFASIKKELKEVATVPPEIFHFRDIHLITDTRLLIFSLKDEMGIAIESAYIAQNEQAVFELAWRGAN